MGSSLQPHLLAPVSVAATPYAQSLATNPDTPVVYMTVKRVGRSGSYEFTLVPSHFEFSQSVKEADRLEFSVPDPSFALIDNEWFTEDLKTTVEFRFGYRSGVMSPLTTLVFFRQKPSFASGSTATTTVVAYDKGIFLAMPTVPKTLKKATNGQNKTEESLLTFNEVIETVVNDVNDTFKGIIDQPFKVETGGETFKGRYFRMTKPHGSALEYLIFLSHFAESDKNPEKRKVEVFVRDHTLYFRPAQKRVDPIAVYDYFSNVPGERLLAFEPEVNLSVNRKTISDVDPVSGDPAQAAVDGRTNAPARPKQTDKVSVSGFNASTRLLPSRLGDARRESTTTDLVEYTHPWKAPETLQDIAAKYHTTPEAVFRLNAAALVDQEKPHFTAGMQLRVQVTTASGKAREDAVTPEAKVRAALSFVYEEDETVKASATVIGDPALQPGWPIVVRNVGRKWQGLWYIVEVRHSVGEHGYTCDLSLTRDGFAIAEEMDSTSGDTVVETPELDAAAQQQKQQRQQATVQVSGFNGAKK